MTHLLINIYRSIHKGTDLPLFSSSPTLSISYKKELRAFVDRKERETKTGLGSRIGFLATVLGDIRVPQVTSSLGPWHNATHPLRPTLGSPFTFLFVLYFLPHSTFLLLFPLSLVLHTLMHLYFEQTFRWIYIYTRQVHTCVCNKECL